MKRSTHALFAAAAIVGLSAGAQAQSPAARGLAAAATTSASIAPGATVYDQSGAVVGTIKAVDGQFATLATASSTVKLPLSSFGTGDKGPLLGMTAAQVDAAASAAAPAPAQTAQAAAPPKLAAGVAVNDTSGNPVGTIEAVDGGFATLATARSKVRLPISAFAGGDKGPVIAMTADQLDAAAAGAQPKTGKN